MEPDIPLPFNCITISVLYFYGFPNSFMLSLYDGRIEWAVLMGNSPPDGQDVIDTSRYMFTFIF
jgi:hypothetical protein